VTSDEWRVTGGRVVLLSCILCLFSFLETTVGCFVFTHGPAVRYYGDGALGQPQGIAPTNTYLGHSYHNITIPLPSGLFWMACAFAVGF